MSVERQPGASQSVDDGEVCPRCSRSTSPSRRRPPGSRPPSPTRTSGSAASSRPLEPLPAAACGGWCTAAPRPLPCAGGRRRSARAPVRRIGDHLQGADRAAHLVLARQRHGARRARRRYRASPTASKLSGICSKIRASTTPARADRPPRGARMDRGGAGRADRWAVGRRPEAGHLQRRVARSLPDSEDSRSARSGTPAVRCARSTAAVRSDTGTSKEQPRSTHTRARSSESARNDGGRGAAVRAGVRAGVRLVPRRGRRPRRHGTGSRQGPVSGTETGFGSSSPSGTSRIRMSRPSGRGSQPHRAPAAAVHPVPGAPGYDADEGLHDLGRTHRALRSPTHRGCRPHDVAVRLAPRPVEELDLEPPRRHPHVAGGARQEVDHLAAPTSRGGRAIPASTSRIVAPCSSTPRTSGASGDPYRIHGPRPCSLKLQICHQVGSRPSGARNVWRSVVKDVVDVEPDSSGTPCVGSAPRWDRSPGSHPNGPVCGDRAGWPRAVGSRSSEAARSFFAPGSRPALRVAARAGRRGNSPSSTRPRTGWAGGCSRAATCSRGSPDEFGGEFSSTWATSPCTSWPTSSRSPSTIASPPSGQGMVRDTWSVDGAAVSEDNIVAQFADVAPLHRGRLRRRQSSDADYALLDQSTLADYLERVPPRARTPELHAVLTSAYRGGTGSRPAPSRR